ncbi:hypothetical protein [Agromyces aerolatus]|uniref:hypothetical protein n=1 Tax=Agromyces sp. LY-1074 TaxID=3074080 RepID=UPI002864E1D6|nr:MULTISPECIES: hypothetical protein [unclassified Agromyces]MDR5700218.1 hypothetical protein [Agromyces sp. LY-1074]MDR5706414.1 hypothetical protein [Agromyces sp. LY-1358]
MGEAQRFEVDVGHGVPPFSGAMVPDVDGRRMLLLAGHADDELLLYGSSLPGRAIPDAQTMLHGGDLIRALAFELPVSFDEAYESDLEPLGPYWRLRRVAPSEVVANAFDVVLTVDDAEELDTATVSLGPVHRAQLEPVAEYLVTVRAAELLEAVARIMGVHWRAD